MTGQSGQVLSFREAVDLQAVEIERSLELLRSLESDDWSAQTECPEWDVRRMYLHVLGACEAGASMRENAHQLRAAMARRKQRGGPLEAALSGLQIDERADLTPTEIVAQLEAVAPKTVKGRRRIPAPVGKLVRIPVDGPVVERWPLAYLAGTIYLRDLWMHRVDATRATGRQMQISRDHDGRIVADVVAEWARRHGKSFVLELSGPAGGEFSGSDTAGPEPPERIEMDAVDFCRTLAGREQGTGLLETIVPF